MNLLGIDFEDWYHPQLVEPFVSEKEKIPIMYKGLDKILNLLRKTNSKATFFLVGELLEFNPEMLDDIISEGHEIGFHTMKHTRLDSLDFQSKFKEELKNLKN
ncbi:polysaccharide deacetylase family protein [Nitrosopumilus adriaticus]|uniref:polysaccharide deacetylase family protein n=1 Tax=Nitrosopumilus adriaticus TaxID=1580092 RepID=UPI000A68BDA5|nr:polysaccharide deacetylase family protein [Nitrosopumilus adriaticus]